MSGWMGERLNAYGEKNGFDVATVVWDGSTIAKWAAKSAQLSKLVSTQKPDLIVICLGLNSLFIQNPSRLDPQLHKIIDALHGTPLLWIGPPSWPGKQKGTAFNNWLESSLPEGSFFLSSDLHLERQSATNPHPTRQATAKWVDQIIEWIPEHTDLHFHSLDTPTGRQFSRGKTFIYKRMRETL